MSQQYSCTEEHIDKFVATIINSSDILRNTEDKEQIVKDFKATFYDAEKNAYIVDENSVTDWVTKSEKYLLNSALSELSSADLINISVDESGEFVYSLTEKGKIFHKMNKDSKE